MKVSVDMTLGRLLRDNGDFDAHPGNLVDVAGDMIEKHAGKPIVVSINGAAVRRDAIDSTTIPQDGMVMVTSGEDVTEDHTVSKETVPHGESINIAGGSIQILKQAGKDGVHEYWVGKRSGKHVDKGVTVEPQDTIVVPLNPRPEGKKVIALTFDDGPSKYSGPILDILKEKGVKATFFDVGEECLSFPDARNACWRRDIRWRAIPTRIRTCRHSAATRCALKSSPGFEHEEGVRACNESAKGAIRGVRQEAVAGDVRPDRHERAVGYRYARLEASRSQGDS